MLGIKGIFLYLKRLEIQGFKSFSTRSVLDFEQTGQITAIVGPNGSGKSNVADAIRWVLGEQSYKAIRSKKSEDVIFSGSDGKNRGSMAKVTMLLDNASGKAPIEFSEVEISRCVYRDGSGEYLINGKKSRLLDVVELLARSGFGQSTYSVIGQGMVDAMLFYGPSERKVLFDEAAGVRQYEIKREQTLKKLEGTQENIVRIKDILSELNPRLNVLKRQTERAKEKDAIAEKLLEKQKIYFASLWDRLSFSEKEKRDDLEKILAEENKIKNEISELDSSFNAALGEERVDFSEVEKIQVTLSEKEKQKDELKQTVYTLRAQLEISASADSLTKNEIERKTQVLQNEISVIEKGDINVRASDLGQEIKKYEDEIENLTKEINTKKGKLNEIQKELSGFDFGMIGGRLKEILTNQKEFIFKLEAAKSVEEIEFLVSASKTIEKDLSELEKKIGDANEGRFEGLSALQKELETLTAKKERLAIEVSNLRSRLFETEFELRRNGERAQEIKNELERLSRLTPVNESEKKEVEKIITNKEKEVSKIDKEISVLRRKIGEKDTGVESKGKELTKIKDDIYEKQKLLTHYSQETTNIQVELAKIETKKQDLKEEINREIKSEALLADAKIVTEIDGEAAREEIEKIKGKLYAIGEIDPEVETEFKEVDERVTFLSGQTEDLEKAKSDLEKLVDELDGKIKKQFEGSFAAISQKFSHFFSVLFEGGSAKLELSKIKSEESILTSEEAELTKQNERDKAGREGFGIDISATPPGKRNQSLNALSGGERTLTSLALLFAILSVNPSPFVMLDEVDAALDESNTKRFLKIIAELGAKTQFIFITHNRLTMETANLLYGITMDELHASKMISVKLADALSTAKKASAKT